MEYVASIIPRVATLGGGGELWSLPGAGAVYQPVGFDAEERKYTVRSVWAGQMGSVLPPVRISPQTSDPNQLVLPLAGHINMAGAVVNCPFKVYTHIYPGFQPSTTSHVAYRIYVDKTVNECASEFVFIKAMCSNLDSIHIEDIEKDDADMSGLAVAPAAATAFLRPSQVECVHKLQHVEACIDDPNFNIKGGHMLPVGSWCTLDLQRQALIPGQVPDARVRMCGGLLTGDRGSGKTRTLIALAMMGGAAPPPEHTDQLLRAQLLPSNATLVIVPRHLLAFWKLEIEACGAAHAAIFLSDVRDFRAVSVQDVLGARLVVCTERYAKLHCSGAAECLERATGTSVLLEAPQTLASVAGERLSSTLATEQIALRRLRLCTKDHPNCNIVGVPLSMFFWKRLVLDEALRMQAPTSPTHTSIYAQYNWAVQAEVGRIHRSQLNSIAHLFVMGDWTPVAAASWARAGVVSFTHTPTEHAEQQGCMFRDTIQWMQLDPDEYLRYEAARACGWSEEQLIKLCAGLPGDQPGSGFAHARCFKDAAGYLEHAFETILSTVNDMTYGPSQQQEIDNFKTVECETRNFLNQTVHKIMKHAAEHDNELDLSVAGAESCSVCLTETPCMLTLCGHMFCWVCIYRTFGNSLYAKCPTCRRVLFAQHVVQFLETGASCGGSCGAESKHVRKMVHLSSVCRDISAQGERVVVFAQWPALVNFLATTLQQRFGIKVRAFTGSAKSQESALRAFDANEISVLVVPHAQCAGLSLTAASHIIFYHAFTDGTDTLPLASVIRTGQTKTVTVHRMIAKGTVEQTLVHHRA